MTTQTFDLEHTVRLAQAGDEGAFADLVMRYKNLVFVAALGVLRDADAASDVTQSVFLTAWQRLRELRSPSSLSPWLRETARRQALHHIRTQVRERARVTETPTIAPADELLAEREEAIGRKDAVLHYLEAVRAFWKLYPECLADWSARIRRGETPDFFAKWACTAP